MSALADRLKEILDDYLRRKDEEDLGLRKAGKRQKPTQGWLAKKLKLSSGTITKYVTGKVPASENFVEGLLTEVYGKGTLEYKAAFAELQALRRVPAKDGSATFAQMSPMAAAFSFPPFFCVDGRHTYSGFTYTLTKRLFDLAGRPLTSERIQLVSSFRSAFEQAKDPSSAINLVLSAAETIPRSVDLYTFPTPATVPLNALTPLQGAQIINRAEIDRVRRDFIRGNPGSTAFLAVREEVGHRYLVDVLKACEAGEGTLQTIETFDASAIAQVLHSAEAQREPRVFVADELTCLNVLIELAKTNGKGAAGFDQYGLLFPLGTLAVAHCEDYTKIPTYKVGLFSVPIRLTAVLEPLKKALNGLFDNERFYVSFAYEELAKSLQSRIEQGINALSPDARLLLYQAHQLAGEQFQFPAVSPEFSKALAARVTRQTLRLNSQIVQDLDDLNLQWRPILERTKKQLGPLPPEYRDLRFDQASVRRRMFPPFVATAEHSSPETSLEDGAAPTATPVVATMPSAIDWTIFGPVLAECADLIKMEEVPPSRSAEVSNTQFDIAVGMFDLARRALDYHFFRFPICMPMNAIVPRESSLDRYGELLSGSSELRRSELLRALSEDVRKGSVSSVVPIVHRYTTAHYLCWDWGADETKFVEQDVNMSFEMQLQAFEDWFVTLSRRRRSDQPVPMVIADELTCLRLLPRLRDANAELLFPPATRRVPHQRRRFFYSIAVSRTDHDYWWSVLGEILPAAVSKNATLIVDELRKLQSSLNAVARQSGAFEESQLDSDYWARDVLCDPTAPGVTFVGLLDPVWLPILSRSHALPVTKNARP